MNISVAIYSYNGLPFIENQLISIAQQSRLPDEIVVSVEPSEDNTLEVIKDFQKKNKLRVKILENPLRKGVTENAWNACRHSSGDVICLADDDDWWLEGKLERIEKAFDDADVAIAFHESLRCNADLGKCRQGVTFHRPDAGHVDFWIPKDPREGGVVPGYVQCFRREVFETIDEAWPQEKHDEFLRENQSKRAIIGHDILIPLVGFSLGQCALIKEPLVLHRMHSKSVKREKLIYSSRITERVQGQLLRAYRRTAGRLSPGQKAKARRRWEQAAILYELMAMSGPRLPLLEERAKVYRKRAGSKLN